MSIRLFSWTGLSIVHGQLLFQGVKWSYIPIFSRFCYISYIIPPTHRVGAILQSPCPSVRSHFRNRYLSFYCKKWFYILYMALAWWLVPCLPFLGLPHIYFLFTVRLTNERVGAFLARRSVQHLVCLEFTILHPKILYFSKTMRKKSWIFNYEWKFYINNK